MPFKPVASPFIVLGVLLLVVPGRAAEQIEQIKRGDTVVVSVEETRLGSGGKVLASLEKGTRLEVLSVKGNWIGVSAVVDGDTLKGWVNRGDVEPATKELGGDQPKEPANPAKGQWPQFHGPNRDNKSPDEGLLKTWPEGGPSRIWEAAGIGEGYSTVAIVGNRIYTTGEIDGDCVITALDMEGKKVWTRKNGKAWAGSYPGTRSIPTVTDGLLYHLSGIGNLICLKADSGDVVWSVNILKKFGGRNTTWGLAESPLVIGDKVICTPGGEEVSMVALDRKTGKVAWKCTGAGDKPGYASPILIDYRGLKQIVTVMSESVVGVRASDGKLLWRYPHKVYADENITTPLFHDGFVIVSGCVKKGTTSLKLQVSGDGCSVKQHWHNKTLDNKQGGIVLLDGRLYGYAETQSRSEPWMCIDFKSGETVFQSAPVRSSYKYKNGCLTYADGMLYLFADNGNMCLVKPTDKGFEVAGRLKIEDPGERRTWAHPVVFGGRLYVRYGDKLGVYNVAGRTKRRNNIQF